MLTTKRSQRTSTRDDNPFRSRFRDARGNFPLRKYLRCREELAQHVVYGLVQLGLTVSMVLFARTLRQFFHRPDVSSPWLERAALFAVLLGAFFLLRRVRSHVLAIFELRNEIQHYKWQLEHQDDDG